jgi:Putative transposase
VVYAKPFGGPEAVLSYLGRYTHRIAINNERLLDGEHAEVRFRYRDYAHGRPRSRASQVEEFIRRFLLHVLPKGLMRIRHYGLLANRHRTEQLRLLRCSRCPHPGPREAETVEAFLVRVLGTDPNRCPAVWSRTATSGQPPLASPSGHRPTAFPMGRLNRCTSPLRRRQPKPPQAPCALASH